MWYCWKGDVSVEHKEVEKSTLPSLSVGFQKRHQGILMMTGKSVTDGEGKIRYLYRKKIDLTIPHTTHKHKLKMNNRLKRKS